MKIASNVSPRRNSVATTDRLRVAAVQFRSEAMLPRNLTRMIAVLEKCAKKGVQVAVFPECALTSYNADAILGLTAADVIAAEKELAGACRRLRIAAIVGTIEHVGRRRLNAAVIIGRDGRIKTRYHK